MGKGSGGKTSVVPPAGEGFTYDRLRTLEEELPSYRPTPGDWERAVASLIERGAPEDSEVSYWSRADNTCWLVARWFERTVA